MIQIEHPKLDLLNRLPVWNALSDLYLDNEIDDAQEKQIVEICATSPFSIEQLDYIMFNELYPVLAGNLRSLAGEWAGFDPVWLKDEIISSSRSLYSLSGRRTHGTPVWVNRVKAFFIFGSQWQALKKQIEKKRSAQLQGSLIK